MTTHNNISLIDNFQGYPEYKFDLDLAYREFLNLPISIMTGELLNQCRGIATLKKEEFRHLFEKIMNEGVDGIDRIKRLKNKESIILGLKLDSLAWNIKYDETKLPNIIRLDVYYAIVCIGKQFERYHIDHLVIAWSLAKRLVIE